MLKKKESVNMRKYHSIWLNEKFNAYIFILDKEINVFSVTGVNDLDNTGRFGPRMANVLQI